MIIECVKDSDNSVSCIIHYIEIKHYALYPLGDVILVYHRQSGNSISIMKYLFLVLVNMYDLSAD